MKQARTAARRRLGGIVLSVLLLSAANGSAEPRIFTDTKGREIVAELVSWKGDTITLNRDGKTFEAKIALFSAADQAFIRKWMEDVPPAIDYHFDFKVEKKKLEGDTVGQGYWREKHSKWAYRITVVNRSRDATSDLTVHYRAYMLNRVDGDYPSDRPEHQTKEGTIKLPNLKTNVSAQFATDPFDLDEVRHYYRNRTTKDEMVGILIRIVDRNGNVVTDFRKGGSSIKNESWKEEKGGGGDITVKPLGS